MNPTSLTLDQIFEHYRSLSPGVVPARLYAKLLADYDLSPAADRAARAALNLPSKQPIRVYRQLRTAQARHERLLQAGFTLSGVVQDGRNYRVLPVHPAHDEIRRALQQEQESRLKDVRRTHHRVIPMKRSGITFAL